MAGTRRLLAAFAALAAVLGAALPAARADIYTFVDERGVVHFTNSPVDRDFRVYKKDAPPGAEVPLDTLPKDLRWDGHIRQLASTYALDPALVKAVMKTESDFNPSAVSNKGAMGLMQLMPGTAERMGVRDPFDPRDNISGGVKYLSALLKQFGNVPLAAAAYNAGENAVSRHGGIPPYAETKDYVRKVVRNYEQYRKAGYGDGSGGAVEPPPEDRIWAVTRTDGVVVFTNTPWSYDGAAVPR